MTRVRKAAKAKMGSIRIIGGQHRGRKLPVLNIDGLRPTTDRMKETLFNWLMSDVRGAQCIDCFAGAGSLGFEALSRGAEKVTFIELNKNAAQQIRSNISLLGVDARYVQVKIGDALKVLSTLDSQPDLIFVDPPFNKALVQPCIDIINTTLAKEGCLIYIEHEAQGLTLALPSNWRLHKEKTTQQVCARVYCVEKSG
ncbi:16S rRNA (guanine(966)-N(2))-methyltransferase RsmD [Glaciecola sp. MH2013]|uniref:16S rRNA (guanine(966)-N(2))-methyltransferase RsmD n=1 Tax=Glaciecola sp. MH2013 TaxID=2785524 RepID=UPI00189FFFC4|nr:16S rRNA (guanine(966)-N(2))-methyltransferase RsmD [Glaciecola sp. MH2013]MBF7073836.1 16S rRNA (guanine(966)-N(2))-methyltransferase RsmD [Glaciecola sp. MH2013]